MTKKEVCSICKRILRTKCFVFNKLIKEKICLRCDKKIGNNKFYSPSKLKKRNDFINKFNITEQEKKVLLRNKSMKEINCLCKNLKRLKIKSFKRKLEEKRKEKLEKQKEKVLNKKFLEGLKEK